MDSMEYRLSKFKNDIANQFGHNVFYNNVLIRVFYYLLEKRIIKYAYCIFYDNVSSSLDGTGMDYTYSVLRVR